MLAPQRSCSGDIPARWPSRRANLRAVLATLVALLIAAPPAVLPSSGAWHAGSAHVYAGCDRCDQTESWASTVTYRDPPNQLPPHRTMAVLGPSDIIIHVTRAWEPSPRSWMLRRRSLRIVPSAIHTNFEGNTTHGRVSLWTGSTWRAGSYVTVWVLFGAPIPAAATVTNAQAELRVARLPVWLHHR